MDCSTRQDVGQVFGKHCYLGHPLRFSYVLYVDRLAIDHLADSALDVAANPVSLFIPGAEGDQPFTGDLLGTDSTGHTTWRIGIGSASGSFTATDGAGAYPSGTSNRHLFPG